MESRTARDCRYDMHQESCDPLFMSMIWCEHLPNIPALLKASMRVMPTNNKRKQVWKGQK